MADAVTQLLLAAKHTAQQAIQVARVEGDPFGVQEAEMAVAALADAADMRILVSHREQTA